MLKKLVITITLIGATALSYGQGTVVFDNQFITTGAAPVFDADGTTRLSGAAFSAQLYSAAGINAAEGSLTAAETRVQFRTGVNTGYVPTGADTQNAFTSQPVDPEVTVTATANGPA